MSMTSQINIHDGVSERLNDFIQRMTPKRIAETIRGPLEYFWRDRLKKFPRLDGKFKGFPATGFGERAARATKGFASETGVTLRCDAQGIRQRYYGGEIKPVNARALTIPISPISYGHSASEFPGLFLLKTNKGAYLVQGGVEQTKKGKDRKRGKDAGGNSKFRRMGALNFLFKLSGGVTQRGNPRVLPTNDEFLEVAQRALERRLK